ncbi:hypothetical protein [Lysobacter niastensis]|uniref:Uncharacterized protein n=1 Tax=Lysobacter niastensis TaxID=380629 RepID=A0ABS0B301_9GAMM|nr:hypothetical protein [Lysobacter niastensis]MBF6022858.1 hypothetical protein [Lysobacter niastensis]
MSLLDSLIECGVESEEAKRMLARVADGEDGALAELCRALTPVLHRALLALAQEDRSR